MNHASEDLVYLTIDSVQWATGHVRPRLTKEDKRAKHRIHQRRFMMRQRERFEQLRREFRSRRIQLLWLQAIEEAAALGKENASLQDQLNAHVPQAEPGVLPVISCPTPRERLPFNAEENVIVELLDLLTEIKAADTKFDDPCWTPRSDDQHLTPLPWLPATLGATSMAGPLV
jgi:hypothetical protein